MGEWGNATTTASSWPTRGRCREVIAGRAFGERSARRRGERLWTAVHIKMQERFVARIATRRFGVGGGGGVMGFEVGQSRRPCLHRVSSRGVRCPLRHRGSTRLCVYVGVCVCVSLRRRRIRTLRHFAWSVCVCVFARPNMRAHFRDFCMVRVTRHGRNFRGRAALASSQGEALASSQGETSASSPTSETAMCFDAQTQPWA